MKKELLQDLTTLGLTKLDATDEANWVSALKVDIGLGADSAIRVILIYSLCGNACMDFCTTS